MPCAPCTIFSPSSCNQYRSLLFFFSKFVNLFKTLCIQACHCLAAQFITNIYYIPFYSSSTSTSLFIQTFNFSMSIMHQAWSISEVRSLIFMQVNLLRDLAQLAATCKAFTKPATLELLAKQTSIARLKQLVPLNAPALVPVCLFILFFLLGLLIYTTRMT
jgi:hypothetical protein